MKFESHGRKYQIDEIGVVTQIDAKPYVYDNKYVSTYDTEAYKRQSDILQALRFGFVVASHGSMPQSLLDWGYGNGAFMKFANQKVMWVYGHDVTGIEVEGCKIVNELMVKGLGYDVVTFWDALEHIEDLSFLETLNSKTVVISLPYCHIMTQGKEWFDTKYKHRKPDEHLRHFNQTSLELLMKRYGWRLVASSNHEDIVRVSTHGLQNILTMSFKR